MQINCGRIAQATWQVPIRSSASPAAFCAGGVQRLGPWPHAFQETQGSQEFRALQPTRLARRGEKESACLRACCFKHSAHKSMHDGPPSFLTDVPYYPPCLPLPRFWPAFCTRRQKSWTTRVLYKLLLLSQKLLVYLREFTFSSNPALCREGKPLLIFTSALGFSPHLCLLLVIWPTPLLDFYQQQTQNVILKRRYLQ